jgi:hypothetical protein
MPYKDPEKRRAYSRAWGKANPDRKRTIVNAARKANPEKYRLRSKAWRVANPEKKKLQDKRKRLKRYGETIESFQSRLLRQDNKCLFCEKEFTPDDPPVIDHCHTKGHVRGLLHSACNWAVGIMEQYGVGQKGFDYVLRCRAEQMEEAA